MARLERARRDERLDHALQRRLEKSRGEGGAREGPSEGGREDGGGCRVETQAHISALFEQRDMLMRYIWQAIRCFDGIKMKYCFLKNNTKNSQFKKTSVFNF
jgi:hypothetical protein